MIDIFSTIINIQGYTIPGTDIFFDLPSVGGWFTKGVFSAIAQGMAIFLGILVVVWVGFALYGAFSIISSMGDPQKIEKGWKTIKSIWIGISYFLMFFALIGLIAVFVGIGYPWDWAENLQQCSINGPAGGRFYFQGKTVIDADGKPVTVSYKEQMDVFRMSNAWRYVAVYCCEDTTGEYITLKTSTVGSSPPAGCALDQLVKQTAVTGPVPTVCRPVAEPCMNNSDCCSNSCKASGAIRYCL